MAETTEQKQARLRKEFAARKAEIDKRKVLQKSSGGASDSVSTPEPLVGSPMDLATDARQWSTCALLDNLQIISKGVGSYAPGALRSEKNGYTPGLNYLSTGVAAITDGPLYEGISLFQSRPETTISILNNSEGADYLFNATVAELSSMVPKISLWVKERGGWDKIDFSQHFHADYFEDRKKLVLLSDDRSAQKKQADILSGRGDRSESGIKQFTFEFDNNMYYERNIKASLKLYFQSAHDLATSEYNRLFKLSDGAPSKTNPKISNNRSADYAKIKDMGFLLNEWGVSGVSAQASSRLSFKNPRFTAYSGDKDHQITKYLETEYFNAESLSATNPQSEPTAAHYKYLKAEIGWQASATSKTPDSKLFTKAIKGTQRTLLLNMTDYDISFKEQGQVEVTLNYIASIDSELRQGPKVDILQGIFSGKPGVNPMYEYVSVPRAALMSKNMVLYDALDTAAAVGRDFDISSYTSKTDGKSYRAKTEDINSNVYREVVPQYHPAPSQAQMDGNAERGPGTKHASSQYKGMGKGYVAMRTGFIYKESGTHMVHLQEEAVRNELGLIELEIQLLKKDASKYEVKQNRKFRSRLGKMKTSTLAVLKMIKRARKIKQSGGLVSLLGSQIRQIQIEAEAVGVDTAVAKRQDAGKIADRFDEKRYVAKLLPVDSHATRTAASGQMARHNAIARAANAKERSAAKAAAIGGEGFDKSQQKYRVDFVTFGALLSTLVSQTPLWAADANRTSSTPQRGVGIILGTFELVDPWDDTKQAVYNIADLPISVGSIHQWFFNRVIDKDRESYHIREVLRDLLTDLVTPALSIACTGPASIPMHIDISVVTTRYTGLEEDLMTMSTYTELSPEIVGFKQGIASAASNPGEDEWSYYVLHSNPLVMRGGNEEADSRYGIHHLTLGKDRGLVKRIEFKRKEMPYLEAMNIEAHHDLGILTIPMDASVEMVGNNYFRHGQIIYINADMGLGRKVADDLKIGGYYMVTKVSNTLDSSGWSTSLNCIWQSERDGDASRGRKGG